MIMICFFLNFFFRRHIVRLKAPNHIDKVSNQLVDKLFNGQQQHQITLLLKKLHGKSLNVRFI